MCLYDTWYSVIQYSLLSGVRVEVINKTDEMYPEYFAPSWFHLQDYMEMHGLQNVE